MSTGSDVVYFSYGVTAVSPGFRPVQKYEMQIAGISDASEAVRFALAAVSENFSEQAKRAFLRRRVTASGYF